MEPQGPPRQNWTEGYSDPLTVAVWSPLPPLLSIHRPKPWISSCLGQKEWVWRREAIPGQIPLPPQGEFQEPPWLDSWVPPYPLLPALPPLGERGEGGFRAEGAGRVFHNLSLPRLWAGLTSSWLVAGTWSLGCQFPQELAQPGTLHPKYGEEPERAAPGSYLQPHMLPTPTAPSSVPLPLCICGFISAPLPPSSSRAPMPGSGCRWNTGRTITATIY